MKKVNIVLLIAALTTLTFGFIYKNEPGAGAPEGLNIGNKAPELKFASPAGKEIALSSLKGKMVLIDFWASWCGPCRMENPTVVEAYKRFKDKSFKKAKGFTIYSISLDKSKDAWIRAIQQDHLEWENHVSDLGGWASKPGQIYGINSIPYNFLLNENGIIVAKNLRGEELMAELEKLSK